MVEYKQCSYSLRKEIKQSKRQYSDKVESQFNGSDTRRMWQGLQTINTDKLNTFFPRFEDNTDAAHSQDSGLRGQRG